MGAPPEAGPKDGVGGGGGGPQKGEKGESNNELANQNIGLS